MKTPRKQTEKEDEASAKLKLVPGWTQVSKTTNRTRVQCPKPTGISEKHAPYLGSTEPYPKKNLCPPAKMKLQLFPIDEGTCMGLEKDGYHPYLELTLSSRKKISSVLKHLNCKWGGSSVAFGEPILFPFNEFENFASYKWKLNDTNISTGDVYNAIGRPSVFRLRYGWFCYSETKFYEVPSKSTSFEACVQSEDVPKGCSTNTEIDEPKHVDVSSEKLEAIIVNGEADSIADKITSNGFVVPVDNEGRMDAGVGQPSALWDDSVTNISIGGLLSEASLQGLLNNHDLKPNGSSAGLQPSQLITDSFDAFIAAQVNPLQVTRPVPHGAASASSILDAEDTCHAFPFQKFSSSGKSDAALGRNDCSQACDEVNFQSGFPHGHGHQETETDLSLRSGLYKDESSLGLSGIKWTDSLGPFDLGLSSSRKIVTDDSLSISRIVS